MASRDEIEAALSQVPGPRWQTARDLNRISFEALFGAGEGARTLRSSGSLRFFGPSVTNHSARLDSTADVLAQWQRLITAIGAARRGIRSSQGPLPGELVTLTQLKIAAAPAGGSLVFDIVPESLPETELLDDGNVAIFDQAQRQFVDECFEDAIGLVFAAHSIGPDADAPVEPQRLPGMVVTELSEPPRSALRTAVDALTEPQPIEPANLTELDGLAPVELETEEAQAFVERVREGGPRLASAVRTFARAIESAEFDLDLEWREPNQATRRATFTRQDAGVVRHLVVSRELEVELQDLVGTLITLSTTRAWQLSVGQDSVLTVDASNLEPASAQALHLGERVTIRARAIQHALPGGGTSTTFEAVTVTSNETPRDREHAN
ncbi:MAG TPA: hypothetical protein VGM45_08830 [Gaiellaceae bacterium]|jgi:hypothetical protein